MFRDNNPSDLDLLQVLKEHEKDPCKKALFDQVYSDILLIFDLDPQDPSFTPQKIQRMMDYLLNHPIWENYI